MRSGKVPTERKAEQSLVDETSCHEKSLLLEKELNAYCTGDRSAKCCPSHPHG